MEKWLDIGAAVLAIAAAIFWFLSAYGKLPPMVAYWDQAPAGDPFYSAIKFSGRDEQMGSIAERIVGLVHGPKTVFVILRRWMTLKRESREASAGTVVNVRGQMAPYPPPEWRTLKYGRPRKRDQTIPFPTIAEAAKLLRASAQQTADNGFCRGGGRRDPGV